MEARLLPLSRQHAMKSVEELVASARRDENEPLREQVRDALLPKETSFFRDMHPFNLLRNLVFKNMEMRRFQEQRLAVWCAGCSSGQEALSVAMVVHRYFSQFLSWDLEIYATDVSREVLGKAAEGRYDELEVHRGVQPLLVKEYFQKDGKHYRINESVSKLVRYDEFNLVNDWPEFQVDVVLLRNVLRYMHPDSQRLVLNRLKQVLKPDGYLLLGSQESASAFDSSFVLVPAEGTFYYQLAPSAINNS